MKNGMRLKFQGDNVELGKYSFSKLAEFVNLYIEMIVKIVEGTVPEYDKKIEFYIKAINPGSLDTEFALSDPDVIWPANEAFFKAVYNHSISELPVAARQKALQLKNRLEAEHVCLQLFNIQGKEVSLLPDSFEDASFQISEGMSLYGELMDIGGIKPNIHIFVPELGKNVKCSISKELAKTLAPRLYTIIGVYGEADISYPNFDIKEFEVIEVLPYTEEGQEETLRKIQELFSEQVKDVDNLTEFFTQMRLNDG